VRDRLEREGDDFRAHAREAYLELAAGGPDRFVVLDGTLTAEALAEEIDERLRSRS
jgi:dTMP kinase